MVDTFSAQTKEQRELFSAIWPVIKNLSASAINPLTSVPYGLQGVDYGWSGLTGRNYAPFYQYGPAEDYSPEKRFFGEDVPFLYFDPNQLVNYDANGIPGGLQMAGGGGGDFPGEGDGPEGPPEEDVALTLQDFIDDPSEAFGQIINWGDYSEGDMVDFAQGLGYENMEAFYEDIVSSAVDPAQWENLQPYVDYAKEIDETEVPGHLFDILVGPQAPSTSAQGQFTVDQPEAFTFGTEGTSYEVQGYKTASYTPVSNEWKPEYTYRVPGEGAPVDNLVSGISGGLQGYLDQLSPVGTPPEILKEIRNLKTQAGNATTPQQLREVLTSVSDTLSGRTVFSQQAIDYFTDVWMAEIDKGAVAGQPRDIFSPDLAKVPLGDEMEFDEFRTPEGYVTFASEIFNTKNPFSGAGAAIPTYKDPITDEEIPGYEIFGRTDYGVGDLLPYEGFYESLDEDIRAGIEEPFNEIGEQMLETFGSRGQAGAIGPGLSGAAQSQLAEFYAEEAGPAITRTAWELYGPATQTAWERKVDNNNYLTELKNKRSENVYADTMFNSVRASDAMIGLINKEYDNAVQEGRDVEAAELLQDSKWWTARSNYKTWRSELESKAGFYTADQNNTAALWKANKVVNRDIWNAQGEVAQDNWLRDAKLDRKKWDAMSKQNQNQWLAENVLERDVRDSNIALQRNVDLAGKMWGLNTDQYKNAVDEAKMDYQNEIKRTMLNYGTYKEEWGMSMDLAKLPYQLLTGLIGQSMPTQVIRPDDDSSAMDWLSAALTGLIFWNPAEEFFG